ncbi:hypothetical protein [Streptomyces sp. NBC_01614]|uniref:hypothetical protein n=1 Tax=Streptomyces sp. NBC_01614 TaxID=2975897 RepID=UPI00386590D3
MAPTDMETYREGRRQATDAADAIRAALACLGLPERVRGGVRPMVTHSGRPYLHLGMVRADVAKLMAQSINAPPRADLTPREPLRGLWGAGFVCGEQGEEACGGCGAGGVAMR